MKLDNSNVDHVIKGASRCRLFHILKVEPCPPDPSMRLTVAVILALGVMYNAEAFMSPVPQGMVSTSLRRQSNLFGSKEEEIAKLEEQLKKLKDDTEASEASSQVATVVEATEQISLDLFLSEQWKEKEAAEEGSSSGLTGILGAVGLGLALLVFSQISFGNEALSQYSANLRNPDTQVNLGDINRARGGDL